MLPIHCHESLDCTMWQMPALLGTGKALKSYFLPLGFPFSPSPDPMRRYDLRRILVGCMHSFRTCISCLKGVSYCTICDKGITDAVKKLSIAASSSYLGDCGNCHESSESTSSVGDDDPGDLENCRSANKTNVEQLPVGLTQKVISLQSQLQPPPVAKPSIQTELFPTRQQNNSNTGTLGKRCPGEICKTDGRQIPYNCVWHSKLSF